MHVGDRVQLQESGAFGLPRFWNGRAGTIKQLIRETGDCVVALDATPERRAVATVVARAALTLMVDRRPAPCDRPKPLVA